jgi:hypothetical protein
MSFALSLILYFIQIQIYITWLKEDLRVEWFSYTVPQNSTMTEIQHNFIGMFLEFYENLHEHSLSPITILGWIKILYKFIFEKNWKTTEMVKKGIVFL